jgi:transcriptional regulator with PAS, ATPase and Fis domain
MRLDHQVKLLRVLQDRSVTRVGSTTSIPVDVRVVADTNADLSTLIESGRFREDLFYRLNVLLVTVPPLRERREDIPRLAKYFVDRIASRQGLRPGDRRGGDGALMVHPWRGSSAARERRRARHGSLAGTVRHRASIFRGDGRSRSGRQSHASPHSTA